ncbi:hypothetical protein ENBRE01_1187 [Enteropsectra breve]|nr:hypothetical protein ENBRE01_1187 [Enteropsectra breve]
MLIIVLLAALATAHTTNRMCDKCSETRQRLKLMFRRAFYLIELNEQYSMHSHYKHRKIFKTPIYLSQSRAVKEHRATMHLPVHFCAVQEDSSTNYCNTRIPLQSRLKPSEGTLLFKNRHLTDKGESQERSQYVKSMNNFLLEETSSASDASLEWDGTFDETRPYGTSIASSASEHQTEMVPPECEKNVIKRYDPIIHLLLSIEEVRLHFETLGGIYRYQDCSAYNVISNNADILAVLNEIDLLVKHLKPDSVVREAFKMLFATLSAESAAFRELTKSIFSLPMKEILDQGSRTACADYGMQHLHIKNTMVASSIQNFFHERVDLKTLAEQTLERDKYVCMSFERDYGADQDVKHSYIIIPEKTQVFFNGSHALSCAVAAVICYDRTNDSYFVYLKEGMNYFARSIYGTVRMDYKNIQRTINENAVFVLLRVSAC